jgi:2-hydroxychromene-2-carboxylate isomerase
MPPLEFYFDFSSPYGYFASEKIDSIARRFNRDVAWRPVLLGVIFKTTGAQPLVGSAPLKGAYFLRDFARSARLLQVAYKQPASFPIPTQHAARAFYWLHDQSPARAIALAHALYRAYFIDGRDISAAETCVEVAAALGVDRAALSAALQDSAVKERLKTEMDGAIANGVFGSPFIIVDGEPFHGADRLDQVERWLGTGGW